jgi:chromate transporter
MMEDEFVRRREWLSREKFLDLLGASNLIPGPSSSELAIHIGYWRAGWRGLLVAGVCFILPAACIVTAIAWAYARFGSLPAVAALLYGIKPVVITVVAQALWTLGRTALKTVFLVFVAVIAAAMGVMGVHPLLLLAAGGSLAVASSQIGRMREQHRSLLFPLPAMERLVPLLQTAVTGVAAGAVGLAPLFLVFLKTGAVVFGSGYVLLAFLRADLVVRHGWLTDGQLLDSIAVGQVTPGPVFTTATFIGYLLGGLPGAVVATVGIFLPAFVLVAVSGPLVPRIRKSKTAGAFLDGVNAGSLALMAVVSWQLGRASIVDAETAILAVVALVVLLWFRVNSGWLVLLGAVAGLLIRRGH